MLSVFKRPWVKPNPVKYFSDYDLQFQKRHLIDFVRQRFSPCHLATRSKVRCAISENNRMKRFSSVKWISGKYSWKTKRSSFFFSKSWLSNMTILQWFVLWWWSRKVVSIQQLHQFWTIFPGIRSGTMMVINGEEQQPSPAEGCRCSRYLWRQSLHSLKTLCLSYKGKIKRLAHLHPYEVTKTLFISIQQQHNSHNKHWMNLKPIQLCVKQLSFIE